MDFIDHRIQQLMNGGSMALGAAHELEKEYSTICHQPAVVRKIAMALLESLHFNVKPNVRGAIKSALKVYARDYDICKKLALDNDTAAKEVGISLLSIEHREWLKCTVDSEYSGWFYCVSDRQLQIFEKDILEIDDEEVKEEDLMELLDAVFEMLSSRQYEISIYEIVYNGVPRKYERIGSSWRYLN